MPIYTRCKPKMNRTSGGPPVSIDGGGKRQEAALRCRFSATPDYSFSWGAVQSNGATVECKQKPSVMQWKTMHQQIKYKDISLHCPSLQIAFCLVFLQAEPKQGHVCFPGSRASFSGPSTISKFARICFTFSGWFFCANKQKSCHRWEVYCQQLPYLLFFSCSLCTCGENE